MNQALAGALTGATIFGLGLYLIPKTCDLIDHIKNHHKTKIIKLQKQKTMTKTTMTTETLTASLTQRQTQEKQQHHWLKIQKATQTWWTPFITKTTQQNRQWKNISWLGIEIEIKMPNKSPQKT